MFESIMKLFGSNERERARKLNAEQRALADTNRKSSDRIAAKLEAAAGYAVNMKSEQNQETFRNFSRDLADNLKGAPTNGICDVTPVDAILSSIAEQYGNALKRGDLAGARAGVERCHEVICLRNALSNCLKEDTEKKLNEAKELAENSKALLEYYDSLYTSEVDYQKAKKECDEAKKQRDTLREGVNAMLEANPAAAAELDNYVPGMTLSPVAQTIFNKQASQTAAADLVDISEKQMSTLELHKTQLTRDAKLAAAAISQQDSTLERETKEATRKLLDKYAQNMSRINDEILEMNDIFSGFINMIDSIYKDPRIARFIIQTEMKYRKNEARIKAEAEANKGRKVNQEVENTVQVNG